MQPNKSIKVLNKRWFLKDGNQPAKSGGWGVAGRGRPVVGWEERSTSEGVAGRGRPVVGWEEPSTSEGGAAAAQAECFPVST